MQEGRLYEFCVKKVLKKLQGRCIRYLSMHVGQDRLKQKKISMKDKLESAYKFAPNHTTRDGKWSGEGVAG